MSLPGSYFDAMYERSPDPWSLTTRWYEQRKYALTVASLPRRRYRSAFEPGCSVGVLSEALAPRCDALLCVDGNGAAVAAARTRLRGHPHVTVAEWQLPAWPSDTFDLVVLSEVAYYLDDADLGRALSAAVASLEPGGHLVAVHWRPRVPDYPQTGAAVHAAIAGTAGLEPLAHHEELDFVLDVLARTPPAAQSVAEAEGLC